MEVKQERTGINMSYNFIFHYIGFDALRIKAALNETPSTVPFKQYIQAFTLHELGHAMDRKALLDSLERTVEIYKMKRKHPVQEQLSNPALLAMLIEEHEMNISFEETAWLNAKRLNRKYNIVDWKNFEQLNQQGITTYYQSYQSDLEKYQTLLESRAQTA